MSMKMEATRSSETSVLTRSTWHHIPEDDTLRSHRRENLKSYNASNGYSSGVIRGHHSDRAENTSHQLVLHGPLSSNSHFPVACSAVVAHQVVCISQYKSLNILELGCKSVVTWREYEDIHSDDPHNLLPWQNNKRRWTNNMKLDLVEIGWGGVD
jgi:hypothetical protein